MKTLTALAAHVRTHLNVINVHEHQVNIFMESGQVFDGSYKLTEEGLHIADFQYRIGIHIDDMPALAGGVLLVTLQTFLKTLNPNQLIGQLQFDLAPVSDRLLDVDASVEVSDPLHLQQVEDGRLQINGMRYDFAVDPFNVAKQIDGMLLDVKD